MSTTHSETLLTEETSQGLRASSAEGAALIGVGVDAAPDAIVDAIDSFVFAWQGGDRPPKRSFDPEDVPFSLGSLWGEQLVRSFGWEWRMITFHSHGDTNAPGVLSPDRALAVYPIHFLIGCLRDPDVDATIMLSYNMLKANKIGEVPAGEYMNLMDGVHRIVPRTHEKPKKSWRNLFRGR